MSEKKTKSRGLGRGLSALMADVGDATDTGQAQKSGAEATAAIELVFPNPDQPRRSFDEEKLDELAESIREKGIIQPLIVRSHPTKANAYEIVAGERRWRAAQRANLHQVPVIIKEFSDTEVLEIAIIENIQRADLNPIDEAAGYVQLMEKFGHTQEQLSRALGKSRSHIANSMRLLQLPPEVRAYVADGRISAGHARALVTADDPKFLAQEVIKKGLSVRQLEKLVKAERSAEGKERKSSSSRSRGDAKDADTRALEADLAANLKMGVAINHKASDETGTVTLSYKSLEQLDALCSLLSAGLPDETR
ncbi:ParB/RepB/Spo0J family partition protein [Roseovarius sp. SCSIO 43702]|uniref:ParB/RepB/Spo0J family partition protein n=1 Tax=Roseovarius sp. SCSIO 43702 TaxID=2823043 RepID=UPI001C730CAE|nr:ParB/RepB/Spo0J family partition protein [Roseovarius sp. SCSIO 43702]QYX56998.1 ParB/RepB/Spo0J family partition protein [Roseovarius sp. SCSIO 43702]